MITVMSTTTTTVSTNATIKLKLAREKCQAEIILFTDRIKI